MGKEHYYHMFANGDDAQNFITCTEEFKAAFNRFALCHHLTRVAVLSMSVEDSHPHALLWGDFASCLKFKDLYEDLSMRCIIQRRGSKDGVTLNIEILEIDDEQYLMNTGTYTIAQATKDGKAIMPYDYLYGTGALYFRSPRTILPWMIDETGHQMEPQRLGDLPVQKQRIICGSRTCLPADYLVCNGFILPTNYIDVKHFESIYRTHNCFRAFLASSKTRDEELLRKMASVRGVAIEDLQARELCKEACLQLFGKQTTRQLSAEGRIRLAQHLRKMYRISYRQLSFLVKIPESELQKYVK